MEAQAVRTLVRTVARNAFPPVKHNERAGCRFAAAGVETTLAPTRFDIAGRPGRLMDESPRGTAET
jgi:hypothetical protein